MRILLNTLYVTTPEAYLSKDGLNVVVSVKQNEIFRIPIHNIEQIITFGYMGASPGLMKLCADNNVSLTFLSPQGRYISRSQGPTRGNVLMRKAQYKNSDEPIIRKTKCFRILKRNAIISKTKRNFSRLYPTPQKIKKNRPASPERNTFEGS